MLKRFLVTSESLGTDPRVASWTVDLVGVFTTELGWDFDDQRRK